MGGTDDKKEVKGTDGVDEKKNAKTTEKSKVEETKLEASAAPAEEVKSETAAPAEETKSEAAAPAADVSKWDEFIAPFAKAVGKEVSAVTESLKKYLGGIGEAEIVLLQSDEDTPLDEIKGALGDVSMPKLRKAVKALRKIQEIEAPAVVAGPSYDILPMVPDDNSFLDMLKVGGVLKVGKVEVIAAIRAALANRTRLYDIPNLLAKKMEVFAQEQDEPCTEDFYKLRKMVTKKNYAEVLAVLNVEGSLMSNARKDKFLATLDSILWDSLKQFQDQLQGWFNTWQQGMQNPGNMVAAITAMMAGGRGGLPAGMMAPPETATLQDSAEGVIDRINKIFAGMGIPIARALAWDANNIKETLENSALPTQLGATSKDQMLKMLKVNVTADYVRLERNITRYALSIMEYPNVTAGDSEIAYLTALFQLGSAIPWDTALGMPSKRISGSQL